MPKAPLLTDDDIEQRLRALEEWKRGGDAIVKVFVFRDFAQALAFVNRIAEPAEAMNHHPDVTIHWNEVTLTLWTHASGGLTHKDFELARAIEDRARP
ncbi:MAG TPA: 4a-hydroxytetrahydrobiopterin dehydratase [Actinomycetota bacterium]|nr:4a-hydroxytetrahydrobiopterin dehydratase [Actinomycetota bacterium]